MRRRPTAQKLAKRARWCLWVAQQEQYAALVAQFLAEIGQVRQALGAAETARDYEMGRATRAAEEREALRRRVAESEEQLSAAYAMPAEASRAPAVGTSQGSRSWWRRLINR